ncbi:MAG: hypothetical protein R3277_07170 [Brumimicrobium sp.]|nr:hypothetical protein [Brumimicrobium sp.]
MKRLMYYFCSVKRGIFIPENVVSVSLLLAITLISLIPACLYAQNTYSGKYQWNEGLSGKAVYNYVLSEDEKIKNGSFLFTREENDSLDGDAFARITINGEYLQNTKNGQWGYEYKLLFPEGGPYIDKLHILRNTQGIRYGVNGFFEKGAATGEWSALETKIENSRVTDTLFYSFVSFTKNRFSGEVISQNNLNQVKGSLTQKGLFEGEWIIVHSDSTVPVVEYLSYKEGILFGHEIKIGNQSYTVMYSGMDHDPQENELWEEIPLNNDYWNVLYFSSLYGKTDSGDMLPSTEVNDLLDKSHDLLNRTFSSFSAHEGKAIWESESPFEDPRVKLRKYPYSDTEEKMIGEMIKSFSTIENVVHTFLSHPQVEVNKNSDREIALYHQVYSVYSEAFNKLNKIVSLYNNPAFEYINRQDLIPEIFSGTEYPDSVSYIFHDSIHRVKIDFPENLPANISTLEELFGHIKKLQLQLIRHQEYIQPIVDKYELKTALSDQESELIEKRDTLIYLYENSAMNDYHRKLADQISGFVKKEFDAYTNLTVTERLEVIANINQCFGELIELYSSLSKVPSQRERIKEIYTRTVWNPYTFTDMKEIVKERIYDAYTDILIDFLLTDISNSIACDKIKGKSDNFTLLFEKMKELRLEDTRELEKKLKKTSDPREILELMGLKFMKR